MIFDFFFYYLTDWFEKNKEMLKWSTPKERSCYLMGVASTCFLYSINDIVHYTILKGIHYQFSVFLFVFLCFGIIQLYNFIYIQRNRFESINPNRFFFVNNLSERSRIVITLSLFIIISLSPFFTFMFFIPFGGHTLKNYQ